MAQGKFWRTTDGKNIIQAHYNKLAALFNAGRFDDIADLYHDTSTILALGSDKLYTGKAAAVKFWKSVSAVQKVKKLNFTIKKINLVHSHRLVPAGDLFRATLQKIAYIGSVSYDLMDGDPEALFAGNGDHLDDCTFGLPEGEYFSF